MRSASRGELRWEEEPAESLKRLSRGNVKLGCVGGGWGQGEEVCIQECVGQKSNMTKDLTLSCVSSLVSVKTLRMVW